MKILLALLSFLPFFSPTPDPCHPPDVKYLFFLHNKFIESHGLMDKHPSYGRVEYQEILDHFKMDGFVVISEKRPAGLDEVVHARKVVGQVDSLLALGIKPANITVVGTSTGGYIAQYVSS